jgi:hypothetical protein
VLVSILGFIRSRIWAISRAMRLGEGFARERL